MQDILDRITKKKQQLDAMQPFPPELVESLEEWLRVELTYSSNAIEGNTLTRVETAEVLERGVSAVINGKPLKDSIEALNHAKALDFIKQLTEERKSHQFITEADIKGIQKLLLTGIRDEWAGVYRQIEIFVRGSEAEFPLPKDVPHLMHQFIHWLQGQQETHPVLLAADAHFKFVNIHPFIDGNGRTARLLMNLILTIHGYPKAVIRNEERTQYLELFDKIRKTHDMQPFHDFIVQAVERSLDKYLEAAKNSSKLDHYK